MCKKAQSTRQTDASHSSYRNLNKRSSSWFQTAILWFASILLLPHPMLPARHPEQKGGSRECAAYSLVSWSSWLSRPPGLVLEASVSIRFNAYYILTCAHLIIGKIQFINQSQQELNSTNNKLEQQIYFNFQLEIGQWQ